MMQHMKLLHHITVVVSEDTRLMAQGDLSKAPEGHDKTGERKAAVELALAQTYNRRGYKRTRIWRAKEDYRT